MAYTFDAEFIETSIFTSQIEELLADVEYRDLQLTLMINPEAGPVIRRSGGLRKIRWSRSGRGKRGGIRVIYYYLSKEGNVLMLFAYDKTEQDDLTPRQLKVLKQIVENELVL